MAAGLTKRRVASSPGILLLAICLPLCMGASPAGDAGALPLRPGEVFPQPGQRGMDEVAELPMRDIGCPACSFAMEVPDVDKLMRRPPNAEETPPWRLHAASRDADLCPHPGPGKLAYRADLVTCPSCGFSAPLADYYTGMDEEARRWVVDTFRPSMRAVQKRLLGGRAATMTDDEIVNFYNRQSEIPDIVRTEHYRVFSLARKDPALVRAEATWQAAWAIRRELASPPKGDFLSGRVAGVQAALAKVKRESEGQSGEIAALAHLLGRDRKGEERLSVADRLAARMLLAGLKARQGLDGEAREIYLTIQTFCHDRYARPDQDPLWPLTNAKAARPIRVAQLEEFRAETEAEVVARMELLRQQEALLREAADLIRSAIALGELNGDPDGALFHAYLVGEFLRRSGNLPLASEWFKLVLGAAPMQSPLEQAARMQLELVRKQAGDGGNLLSAVGEDGELLDAVRKINRRD